MQQYARLEQLVGRTPLVRLQRLAEAAAPGSATVVLGKLEGHNPAGSVKDRPALAMIAQAQARGEICPGDTLIEATSGNMGVALAMVAALRGYRMVLLMPEDCDVCRAQAMRAYGAEIVFTPKAAGLEYARDLALHMQAQGKGRVLDQFANPDNARAHYEGTGAEIWADTKGEVTHLVASMGSTGTIMGVARYLKERKPAVRVLGVQPAPGAHIAGTRAWSDAYRPAIYDGSLIDEVFEVTQAHAQHMCARLAREEGLFAGMSSGAACHVALEVAQRAHGATVVFIVCDRADRYLSSGMFPL